ncbi:Hachiman antiphage defense system protein HamA [Pedobacter sp. AW31-3R]|uniref:Hachiman antiphage defense system protein HamA n=1 Tax=Pedobacter sp. AW31-3R TaxID=3445781 RepID=UPI003FA13635
MTLLNLININKSWIDRELTHHYSKNANNKLKVRLFTIKATGTTISPNSLANALLDFLPDYFKTKVEINAEIRRQMDDFVAEGSTATEIEMHEKSIALVQNRTYRQASKFFNKKSAKNKTGKYGELLLFACAEALFECKMIAHKITNLTNYHDEVKGGDGIFLGNYLLSDFTKKAAYFIGESKVWKQYASAQKDALDSINRFYDDDVQATFTGLEFFIAKKDISKFDDGQIDINQIYDRLNPTSSAFKDQIAVHPILIMYDSPSYTKLMTAAVDNVALEELIAESVKAKLLKTLEGISSKVGAYKHLNKVYLDLILIPTESVDAFNKTMDSLI